MHLVGQKLRVKTCIAIQSSLGLKGGESISASLITMTDISNVQIILNDLQVRKQAYYHLYLYYYPVLCRKPECGNILLTSTQSPIILRVLGTI